MQSTSALRHGNANSKIQTQAEEVTIEEAQIADFLRINSQTGGVRCGRAA